MIGVFVQLNRDPHRPVGYVLDGDGCWLWVGSTMKSGYGVSSLPPSSKQGLAHRQVYEMMVGPIPIGLQLDHLCRNRGCVNPSHLEPVTIRTNVLRGIGPTAVNAAKERCRGGHSLRDPANVLTYRNKRYCRQCHAANEKNRRRRRALLPTPSAGTTEGGAE